MSYAEIIERVEAIQTIAAKANTFDASVKDAMIASYEVESIANEVMAAVADERAREAAMVAEWEERQDAMADAVSANWGHD